MGQHTKNGWNFLPGGIQPFPVLSACGSGCGSRQKESRPGQSQHKKQAGNLFAISTLICNTRIKLAPKDFCKYTTKASHISREAFVNGGGEWIRTTEVVDNRFTVCPLWPLGNSPINYAILYKACPAFLSGRTAQFGAGERTRTPDLLITNQLLYQLSYTSSSLSAFLLYSLFLKMSSLFLIFL